jgi:hypothetical protein
LYDPLYNIIKVTINVAIGNIIYASLVGLITPPKKNNENPINGANRTVILLSVDFVSVYTDGYINEIASSVEKTLNDCVTFKPNAKPF